MFGACWADVRGGMVALPMVGWVIKFLDAMLLYPTAGRNASPLPCLTGAVLYPSPGGRQRRGRGGGEGCRSRVRAGLWQGVRRRGRGRGG